jgi:hypothetical protein
MFFPRFEYHMFYILYQFVTYLLSLPSRCVPWCLGSMTKLPGVAQGGMGCCVPGL